MKRETYLFTGLVMGLCTTSAVLAADKQGDLIDRHCPGAAAWAKAEQEKELGRDAPGEPNAALTPGNPTLRRELIKRESADQQARNAWVSANAKKKSAAVTSMLEVDKANLTWLKSQVAARGAPTVAMVGVEGMRALWTLVQHADSDPEFQQQMLDAFRPQLATGRFNRSAFAMLTDRVLVHQGKPQRYGSQFTPDPAHAGKMITDPVEDIAHLDQRRATVGLMPAEEYRCVISAMYEMAP